MYLAVFLDILNVILEIAEIKRVRVVDAFNFLFMNVDFGVGTFVVVFTVIVVQVGVDDNVDIFGCEGPIWASPSSKVYILPFRDASRAGDWIGLISPVSTRIVLSPPWKVPAIDRYGVDLAIAVLIGHHGFVEYF